MIQVFSAAGTLFFMVSLRFFLFLYLSRKLYIHQVASNIEEQAANGQTSSTAKQATDATSRRCHVLSEV